MNGGEPSSGPLSSALVMRWRLPIACVTAALSRWLLTGARTGSPLRLTGEMDLVTAPNVVESIRSLLGPNIQHVRLDLTQLTFIDAAGLRALVQARMLVHGRGGQLTLHGARPLLRRMLEITELDTAFDLESDLTTPV